MEKPPYNICDRYAIILKNMFFVAFYAPIIPISLLITSIWLIMFYWVEKVKDISFFLTKKKSIILLEEGQ